MIIELLLKKIRERYDFSEEEAGLLRGCMSDTATFGRNDIVVPEDEPVHFSSLLLDGFAARTKYLENGSRQIMEICIPGDFVDLHSYPLERLDHSITALSPCRIMKLPHRNITELIDAHPRIGRILWFATMIDGAIHREWLVSLGSRSALQRLAHLFCELLCRMRVVGLADGLEYPLPINQAELGEARGLTSVHVNRMLRQLREQGLVEVRQKTVRILDLDRLEQVADFDPSYLYLGRRSTDA